MSTRAESAGKGTAAIALAKIYFVLAGFVVQFVLPRLLGSPERYGEYSAAISNVSIFNNVMIAATVQTVSKLVSEDDANGPATLRRSLLLQLGLGALVAGGLAASAGFVGDAMHDPEYPGLLRLASVVVFAYALYAALVGALNGQRRFVAQARFDATFTTLRTVGLLAGGAMLGVVGAISGFATAAVTIAVAALAVVGLGARGEGAALSRFVAFMAPIWLYQGCLNGLLLLDQLLLKGRLADLAIASGLDPVAAVELANTRAGLYKAAQSFAFVPYQLVITATLVVFPMVSHATASGDAVAARRAVGNAGRFSIVALFAISAPILGAADGVLRLLGPSYGVAADALRILALGLVAFTLFALAATVLAGAGKPTVSAVIALVALVAMIVVDYYAIGVAGTSDAVLVALATGTSVVMGAAAITAIAIVVQQFGTFIPLATLGRSLVAAIVGGGVSYAIPHARPLLAIVAAAAGGLAYLVVLAVTGEARELVAIVRGRNTPRDGADSRTR